MIVTLRYRLLPTKTQHRVLERILEQQRQLYNAALEERIDAFRKAGLTLNYFDQCKSLTEWRQSDTEASAIPANLQRWTLKRLHQAYLGSFRRLKAGKRAGFPRYRSKGRFRTFGFNQFQGIRFDRGRIRFKGLPGQLRVHLHRAVPEGAHIRSCDFRKDTKGWSIGFAVEVGMAPRRPPERVVGVDLGISVFAALSDGGFIPSVNSARRAQRRLRKAQRALSRKVRSSSGRRKASKEVARCHAAIARKRADHLHQASARLVQAYDVIAIENLNVKALARGFLGKHVRDATWGKFISMLHYKAECAGSVVVEVDAYGTTQECSVCGAGTHKELGDRRHECYFCGASMERDLNAARNILNRAGVGPGSHNVAAEACVRTETSVAA